MSNSMEFNNAALNQTDIPELDAQTANQLLNNVFAACDMEPSTIPVEVLESWGNYKKPKFHAGKLVSYIFLVILILLPLMFFNPTIIAERTEVNSTSNAIYNIQIKTLMPIRNVSATLNNAPVELHQTNSKEFTVELTDNGTLDIKAVSVNGQVTTKSYEVSHIDKDKPVFVNSYTRNNFVYLVVEDTYSGIDYEGISGLKPESYDEETGTIIFRIPNDTITVTIPDNVGNELTLILSPIED